MDNSEIIIILIILSLLTIISLGLSIYITFRDKVNFKDIKVNRNTILGEDSNSSLIINANLESNIVPDKNNVWSLGSENNKWKNIYVEELNSVNSVEANKGIYVEGLKDIALSLKIDQGLSFNSNDDLTVQLGNGLLFDSNGGVSIDDSNLVVYNEDRNVEINGNLIIDNSYLTLKSDSNWDIKNDINKGLLFISNNDYGTSTRLTINPEGFIGLGKEDPSTLLYLSSPNYPVLTLNAATDNKAKTGIRLQGGSSTIGIDNYTNWEIQNNEGKALIISTKSGISTTGLLIEGNGNTAINSDFTNDYKLYVNGEAYATGSWFSSDARLKKNDENIYNACSIIMKLRPCIYDKKQVLSIEEDKEIIWKKEAGFIAQEVYYNVPELKYMIKPGIYSDVKEVKTENYSDWGKTPAGINYIALIPYIIKMNQEQEEKIKELENRIIYLESEEKIKELENRIIYLESRDESESEDEIKSKHESESEDEIKSKQESESEDEIKSKEESEDEIKSKEKSKNKKKKKKK